MSAALNRIDPANQIDLLENAACLWEAFLDFINQPDHPAHAASAAYRSQNGMAASRTVTVGLAAEIETAWRGLPDDARDGWAMPFDWEFAPHWLARRMGWIAGNPVEASVSIMALTCN